MPDIMSHIFMGYDVLNALPEKNNFKISAAKHEGLFNDGLQGPDPFLYREIFPWNRSSISDIGNRMHKEKTGAFLLGLLNDLRISENCNDMKSACICGLICHYSLDTICHPYIFYFCSVCNTVCDSRPYFCLNTIQTREKAAPSPWPAFLILLYLSAMYIINIIYQSFVLYVKLQIGSLTL